MRIRATLGVVYLATAANLLVVSAGENDFASEVSSFPVPIRPTLKNFAAPGIFSLLFVLEAWFLFYRKYRPITDDLKKLLVVVSCLIITTILFELIFKGMFAGIFVMWLLMPPYLMLAPIVASVHKPPRSCSLSANDPSIDFSSVSIKDFKSHLQNIKDDAGKMLKLANGFAHFVNSTVLANLEGRPLLLLLKKVDDFREAVNIITGNTEFGKDPRDFVLKALGDNNPFGSSLDPNLFKEIMAEFKITAGKITADTEDDKENLSTLIDLFEQHLKTIVAAAGDGALEALKEYSKEFVDLKPFEDILAKTKLSAAEGKIKLLDGDINFNVMKNIVEQAGISQSLSVSNEVFLPLLAALEEHFDAVIVKDSSNALKNLKIYEGLFNSNSMLMNAFASAKLKALLGTEELFDADRVTSTLLANALQDAGVTPEMTENMKIQEIAARLLILFTSIAQKDPTGSTLGGFDEAAKVHPSFVTALKQVQNSFRTGNMLVVILMNDEHFKYSVDGGERLKFIFDDAHVTPALDAKTPGLVGVATKLATLFDSIAQRDKDVAIERLNTYDGAAGCHLLFMNALQKAKMSVLEHYSNLDGLFPRDHPDPEGFMNIVTKAGITPSLPSDNLALKKIVDKFKVHIEKIFNSNKAQFLQDIGKYDEAVAVHLLFKAAVDEKKNSLGGESRLFAIAEDNEHFKYSVDGGRRLKSIFDDARVTPALGANTPGLVGVATKLAALFDSIAQRDKDVAIERLNTYDGAAGCHLLFMNALQKAKMSVLEHYSNLDGLFPSDHPDPEGFMNIVTKAGITPSLPSDNLALKKIVDKFKVHIEKIFNSNKAQFLQDIGKYDEAVAVHLLFKAAVDEKKNSLGGESRLFAIAEDNEHFKYSVDGGRRLKSIFDDARVTPALGANTPGLVGVATKLAALFDSIAQRDKDVAIERLNTYDGAAGCHLLFMNALQKAKMSVLEHYSNLDGLFPSDHPDPEGFMNIVTKAGITPSLPSDNLALLKIVDKFKDHIRKIFNANNAQLALTLIGKYEEAVKVHQTFVDTLSEAKEKLTKIAFSTREKLARNVADATAFSIAMTQAEISPTLLESSKRLHIAADVLGQHLETIKYGNDAMEKVSAYNEAVKLHPLLSKKLDLAKNSIRAELSKKPDLFKGDACDLTGFKDVVKNAGITPSLDNSDPGLIAIKQQFAKHLDRICDSKDKVSHNLKTYLGACNCHPLFKDALNTAFVKMAHGKFNHISKIIDKSNLTKVFDAFPVDTQISSDNEALKSFLASFKAKLETMTKLQIESLTLYLQTLHRDFLASQVEVLKLKK